MPACLVAETSEFSHYSLALPALWQEITGGGQLGPPPLGGLPWAMPWGGGGAGRGAGGVLNSYLLS